MKKITLADIAKKTGYSVNTVSHALRDMKDISESVKVYINDTAKEMGYIPNIAAGALRNGKTKNIALIAEDITKPFFSHIAKETELILRKKGYTLTIFSTLADKELTHSAVLSAISKNVDGIIFCTGKLPSSDIGLIKESGIPCIFTDSYICENYDESGYLLGSYIASFGHRKVLLFSESENMGIKKALEEVSGKVVTDASQAEKALKKNSDCSCIICSEYNQALDIYSILHKSDKKIPEDISIAAFSLVEEESPLRITSAGASAKELAQRILSHLPDFSDDKEIPPVTAVLFEGETVNVPSRRFTAKKALSDYLL